jgi:hypothetical protein
LTRIGITAPVDSPNGICPSTDSKLEASPECVVKLKNVFPSVVKIWSRMVFERKFCAVSVSDVEYRNNRSYSVKPGSIVYSGKFFFDVSEVRTHIAGVDIDAFTEELFYFGDEGVFGRKVQANEGDVGCLETACERRDVV